LEGIFDVLMSELTSDEPGEPLWRTHEVLGAAKERTTIEWKRICLA